MELEETTYHGPELEEPAARGSRARGFLGALGGALIGVIPWYLASTFTHMFVGWLGFLVGFAACWGYRKLQGRRSYGFAMPMVLLTSCLALVAADFASNLTELCMNPEWQAAAQRDHVSLVAIAAEFMLLPKNLPRYLPNLALGLFIGLLGAFSAGGSLRKYTDPDRAPRAAALVQQDLAPTALELPHSFVLRMNKSTGTAGKVLLALAAGMAVLFVAIGTASGEPVVTLVAIPVCLIFGLEGLVFLLLNRRYCLEVTGEQLRFVARSGKERLFSAGEIQEVSTPSQLTLILRDREGQILAKLNRNMENLPLLMQYLAEHHVPLRG